MSDRATDLQNAAAKVRDNSKPNEGVAYTSPRWDVSQERAFIETLLGQRMGFLLVFFGLVIAGAVNARTLPIVQFSILACGTLFAAMLALAIGRAQKKLDLLLSVLKQDPHHPVTIIDEMAGPSGSKRKLIGYAIPWLCVLALTCASIASLVTSLREFPSMANHETSQIGGS